MGRYRSLSPPRSRSPPPRKRFDDPRVQRSHRRRRSPAPSGLLVRNVSLDTRPEELRISFERFGPVKDVYLPKNYYTGEPRGFAFVKFHDPEDALEAKEQLNRQILGGQEISIVFAEENRKTPQEMRRNTGTSRSYGGSYRRTPSRSPRRGYRYGLFSLGIPSYSRSRSPARHYSRSISQSSLPRDRSHSLKETSHGDKRYRSSSRCLSSRENAPRDEDYKISRTSPHPREKASFFQGDCRPSPRSHGPREFSPHVVHKKSDRRFFSPRQCSPNHAITSKGTASSRELSPHTERKGKLNERAPLSDDSPHK